MRLKVKQQAVPKQPPAGGISEEAAQISCDSKVQAAEGIGHHGGEAELQKSASANLDKKRKQEAKKKTEEKAAKKAQKKEADLKAAAHEDQQKKKDARQRKKEAEGKKASRAIHLLGCWAAPVQAKLSHFASRKVW